MHRILCLFFCILYFASSTEYTFSQSIKFSHLAPEDKSGFGNVWSVIEDHEGFIWFGTEDGLYKYDGYSVIAYQHNKQDSTSVSGNFITSLFEDSHNNLWIGTFGDGLNLYNRTKNNFYNFKHDPKNKFSLPNNRVKTITECKDGTLWFGTEGGGIGLIKSDSQYPDKIRFDVINHDPNNPNSLTSNFVHSIAEDKKNGLVYVGTFGGGMDCIDMKKKTFTNFHSDAKNPNTISSDRVVEILIDSRDRVWLGTMDSGLDLYLPEHHKFIHYPAGNGPGKLLDNEVETLAEDDQGTLWAGTDNGLSMMTDSKSLIPKNNFENFRHEPLDEYSILSNSVKIIYVDSRNTLWVGTYFGGINTYNSKQYKFKPIRNKSWIEASLSNNNVTSFAEDKDGNLWIGTDAGGLNFLPRAFDNLYEDGYKNIKIQNPVTGKIETKIKSLEIDHAGYLWIGLWGDGLYRLDTKTQKLKYYGPGYSNSPKFSGSNVLQIRADKNDNLWIGTFERGMFFYDRKADTFTHYLLDPNWEFAATGERIRALLIDSKGRVWIGGNLGGLNLFNKEKKSFERINYKDILTPNVTILNLLESSDGKIWIGTVSSGAIVYDPETKKAWFHTEESEFMNYVIGAMLEDASGKIWMSTAKGLNVFNPKDKTTIHYSKNDGLQGNHFNSGSALKCSNGMLLFGGTRGWNAIQPDSIYANHTLPKIAFTNFWLNNKLVDINSPESPLTAQINSDQPIDLAYNQNSFSVEFVALEFNPARNNKYAYKLEGFNDDGWQYINTDRKATFTNLFPGQYKLRVKATNQDGFWTERPLPLIIVIHPAWWQTTWFKSGAVAFFIIIVYSSFWLRTKYLLSHRRKLKAEVQKQTIELTEKNTELANLNREIQSQNEELISQNDQIISHREELEDAQNKLKKINEQLEELVKSRTEKLETTIKELDKTVFELDRFVYSASHDLSAPLKSILGLVHVAKMEKDQQIVNQYYNYIENSIDKLEVVIRNLVEYSRNSHTEIGSKSFNFHNLINDIIDELAFWPEAKKVNIVNASDPSINITNDEQRIKVILHNLISNGIKYADHTKETSFVKIECILRESSWDMEISDNGIGIDHENKNKVFEMYFRATDRSQGSGLGLFIVKEIVNKLRGSISITSAKGKGTAFHIQLPLLQHP